MATRRLDWDLLVRAGGDPLTLARERLLSGREPLDEVAERLLTGCFEKMDPTDLVSWLARRGREPSERPAGVPSSKVLVARILAQWDPRDGLGLSRSDGRATLLGVDVSSIEPEVLDDLIEQILPTLPEPFRRHLLGAALACLQGCALFKALRELAETARIPYEVRQRALAPGEEPLGELCVRLMPHRRDPKELTRRLLDDATSAVGVGTLVPLWVLDQLGLLDAVKAPDDVLPRRVWFPCEPTADSVPYAQYPVTLALRWPGGAALPWVRTQIVDALRRGVDRARMGNLLLGPVLEETRHVDGEDPSLTPHLRDWLADRARFDDLMRASVDLDAPLPTAWVTVVRDLCDARDDAWPRALRWLDAPPLDVYLDERGHVVHLARPIRDAWPDLQPTEVDTALRARQWILLRAKLPRDVDASLGARLAGHIAAFARLSRRPGFTYAWSLRSLAEERALRAACWSRLVEFPPSPEGREGLLAMLRERPELLSVGDERVVEHLGSLDAEAFPPVAPTNPSLRPLVRAPRWRARYLRLGGSPALRRILHALNIEPVELSPEALWRHPNATNLRNKQPTLLLDLLEHLGNRRNELVERVLSLLDDRDPERVSNCNAEGVHATRRSMIAVNAT